MRIMIGVLLAALSFSVSCAHLGGKPDSNTVTDADRPSSGPVYRFVLSPHPTEKSWEAIKYDPVTGKAWMIHSSSRWVALIDKEPIPRSTYEIQLINIANDGWQALRVDLMTGDAWIVVESVNWLKIENERIDGAALNSRQP